MDSKQYEPVAVPTKNITKQQEDLYVSLPDLYIRKYVLSEKLCTIKKPYIPKVNLSNNTNLEVLRVPKVWQQVMNDIQLKALDIQERKKWRIAVKYQLAQEAKQAHQLLQKEREEIEQFGICISHQLCVMLEKQIRSDELPYKPIHCYLSSLEVEPQTLDEQRYQDALQKVKRYIATNRDVYVTLESLFPEGPNYSESNTQDVSDRKIKQTVDFDFKKKYENIQEVLQLFVNRDLPLKESFEKSIMGIEGFPMSLDMIYKYKPKHYYQEPCLDPDYEELLYRIGCTPEQVLYDGEKMMKRMKVFQTTQITDAPMPAQLELRDLFRYKHNFIERDCNFIQQNGKFIPLDGERFNSHIQQIVKSNELVKHYFIYYYHKYQGDFQQISFALSSNTVTGNLFLYSVNFCADLYAWFVYNKSIPINSKFILPLTYYSKCENSLQPKKIIKPHYSNILSDYESLIKRDLPIKKQTFKEIPQIPSKDYKKQIFKELMTKIKFDIPTSIKPSIQADYSMVEKLSFSNLPELVKQANSSKSHIDKRYKNIFEIAKYDCNPMEVIKKEYRKNQRQQSAQMPGQRMYPMPMPGGRMMPPNMPPQGYDNKGVMPPMNYQPKAQPQQTIEQISNTQPIVMPPQQPPQQQPPPVQQPPPQQVQQAPPPPTTAPSRPRKRAEPPQPAPQAPQPPPPATPVKKSRKKEDPQSVTEDQQPPVAAPPAPRQQPQKRTKKQQKANDKKQNEEDKDEGA